MTMAEIFGTASEEIPVLPSEQSYRSQEARLEILLMWQDYSVLSFLFCCVLFCSVVLHNPFTAQLLSISTNTHRP